MKSKEHGAAARPSSIAVKGYFAFMEKFFLTHCVTCSPSGLGRLEKVCLGLLPFPGPMDLSARGRRLKDLEAMWRRKCNAKSL